MKGLVDTGLFIGGAADGMRMTVMPGHSQVRVPSRGSVAGRHEMAEASRPINEDRYSPMCFAGERQVYQIWAHDELTPDDVLARLFAGYPIEPRHRASPRHVFEPARRQAAGSNEMGLSDR